MKILIIASVFSSIHLIEDLIWLTLGRYTEIPFSWVFAAIVLMGILGGIAIRHPKAKRFLGH